MLHDPSQQQPPRGIADAEPDAPATDTLFRFEGVDIECDLDEMVSLTEIWEAAGSPPGRGPWDWLRDGGRGPVEHLAGRDEGRDDCVVEVRPGEDGVEVLARRELGVFYAQHLSPAFAFEVVDAFDEWSMEEEFPEMAICRGIEAYLGCGCDRAGVEEELAILLQDCVEGMAADGSLAGNCDPTIIAMTAPAEGPAVEKGDRGRSRGEPARGLVGRRGPVHRRGGGAMRRASLHFVLSPRSHATPDLPGVPPGYSGEALPAEPEIAWLESPGRPCSAPAAAAASRDSGSSPAAPGHTFSPHWWPGPGAAPVGRDNLQAASHVPRGPPAHLGPRARGAAGLDTAQRDLTSRSPISAIGRGEPEGLFRPGGPSRGPCNDTPATNDFRKSLAVVRIAPGL